MKRAASTGDLNGQKKSKGASDTGGKKRQSTSDSAMAETSFPRGGGGKAQTPYESKGSLRKSEGETLFKRESKTPTKTPASAEKVKSRKGQPTKASTAARTKKRKGDEKMMRHGNDIEDLDGTGTDGMRIPREVKPLRFKNVNEGMFLAGVVKEVREAEALISLPNNLTGWVEVDHVSDELNELIESTLEDEEADAPALSDYLWPGKLVRCVVLSTATVSGKGKQSGSHKHVAVSLKPSLCNSGLSLGSVHAGLAVYGAVASVEDHGVKVSLGTDQVEAFLPFTNIPEQIKPTMRVGQLIEGIVKRVNVGGRLATLTVDDDELAGAVTKDVEEFSLDALQPGMLVACGVLKVLPSGLVVRFLSSFVGTIELFHLPSLLDAPAKRDSSGEAVNPLTAGFREKQKVIARIIQVDVGAKAVALSMRPHILDRTAPAFAKKGIKVGTIYNKATVVKVDPGIGMVLRLKANEDEDDKAKEDKEDQEDGEQEQEGGAKKTDDLEGWVHISNVGDGRVEKIEKSYKVGRQVRCRISGFSWMDGMVTVTMKESVLEAAVMLYEELSAGDKIKARVIKVDTFGCLVALNESSDRSGVRGLIPSTHLADVALRNPEKKLTPGKLVSCRVLWVKAGERKLVLTLKKTLVTSPLPIVASYDQIRPGVVAHGYVNKIQHNGIVVSFFGQVAGFVPRSQLETEGESLEEAYSIGQVVKARVVSYDAENRRLKLSLKGAEEAGAEEEAAGGDKAVIAVGEVVTATVTSKKEGELVVKTESGAVGRLSREHVGDHVGLSAALFEELKAGAEVEVMGLERERGAAGVTRVTMKPSLIRAQREGALPSAVAHVRLQQFLQGYVRSVTAYGCFVGFAGGLSALAPIQSLSSQFVTNPGELFDVGQSVRCCVVSIEQGKFGVSLKPAVCMCPDTGFLDSLLDQERLLARLRASADGESAPELLKGGAVLKVEAEEMRDYGPLFALPGGEAGHCPTNQLGGVDVKVGKKYQAVVLAHDGVKDMVTLSLDPALVGQLAAVKGTDKLKKAAKLKGSDSVAVVVQAVLEDRVVVTLPDFGHAIAIGAAQDFNLRGEAARSRFEVGKRGQAVVLGVRDGQVLLSIGTDLGSTKEVKKSKGEKEDKKGKQARAIAEELDAIGGGLASVSEAKPGMEVKGVVVGVLPGYLSLRLGQNVNAHVNVTDVVDDDDEEGGGLPAHSPLAGFKKGQVVTGRVLKGGAAGKKDASTKGGKQQEGTDKKSEAKKNLKGKGGKAGPGPQPDDHSLVHLTLRPSDLALPPGAVPAARPTLETLKVGERLTGFVEEIKGDCLWVRVASGLKGRVQALDASKDLDVVQDLAGAFKVGQGVVCRVAVVDATAGKLDLSLRGVARKGAHAEEKDDKKKKKKRGLEEEEGEEGEEVKVGDLIPGKVQRVMPGVGYLMQLGAGRVGRVSLCDVADTATENPLALLSAGQLAVCCVVAVSGDRVDLSLRPSRVGSAAAVTPQKKKGKTAGKDSKAKGKEGEEELAAMPEVESASQLSAGQIVSGYVKSVSSAGCFVQLGRNTAARVILSQLSDRYVKDVKGAYPPGKLVTGRLLSVDAKKGLVDMSLKRSVVLATKRVLFSDLEVGQVIRGRVKSLQSFGVFVTLRSSDISGLCHISEVSEDYVKDLAKVYAVGDAVKAKILRLDQTKKTVSLGMKPEYFEGVEEMEEDDDDEDEEEEEEENALRLVDDEESDEIGDDDDDDEEKEDEEDEDEDEDEEKEEEGGKMAMVVDDDEEEDDEDEDVDVEAALKGSSGFEWDDFGVGVGDGSKGGEDDSDDEEEEEEEDEEGKGKSKSKEKRRKKKEQEEKEKDVRAREAALLDADRAPETAAEFERLLVASPNSSYIWIKYMALHLNMTEIEKAREVSERGLKQINFREERERFNVWVARMNLEALYGSKDTLMSVFEEACKVCDAKKMHLQLLAILEKGSEPQVTEQFFKTVTRKYRQSCKVWLRYCQYKLSSAHPEAAGRTLDKAIAALPKRKHVKLISKFALMEYKLGSAERGATLMEGVVSSYPKRVDLWSVFIDMQLKAGNLDGARGLLARAVTLKLRARQAKFFFKRWLELEKTHGTAETVADVKDKAREWVEANAS